LLAAAILITDRYMSNPKARLKIQYALNLKMDLSGIVLSIVD